MSVTQEEKNNKNSLQDLKDLRRKKIFQKNKLVRIEVSELPKKFPDFENTNLTKDNLIAEWMQKWIKSGIKKNRLQPNMLLPQKEEFARYLGVSIGTIQNAIRFIEDNGYVESKQRIGTMIRDLEQPVSRVRKQTSKREHAIVAVKKHILEAGFKENDVLPSAREVAKIIGSTPNTTRLALEHLVSLGIVKTRGYRGNLANWALKAIPELTNEELENIGPNIESNTLVDQVEKNLKDYISQEFKVNDKLPSHHLLAKKLKVSIKTLHDAIRRLVEQGILNSRRGRYGTSIARIPHGEQVFQPKPESSIFASAQDAGFYNYERVQRHLKNIIKTEYKIGDKLPSMTMLAQKLDVSSNIIRKALQLLADENVVEFVRGRYGGTFIINAPKISEVKGFTWLSVNPEHIKLYKKNTAENTVLN
ncbi:MAG: GntR family transcriptional regulator [Candidatus Gastranaerophilales bacterium]|nr:GntR family transcriptional regulator [Candidatus Gastranaerophilales bacterium]